MCTGDLEQSGVQLIHTGECCAHPSRIPPVFTDHGAKRPGAFASIPPHDAAWLSHRPLIGVAVPLCPIEHVVTPRPLPDMRHQWIDVSMNACQHVARAQHPDGRWQHDSTQQLIRVTLRSSSPLTTICLRPEPAITIVAFCPSPKPAIVWGRPLDHVRPKSVDFALAHWR